MKKMLAVGAIVMIGIVMVGIAGISADNEQAKVYEAEVRVNDAHSTYFILDDEDLLIYSMKQFRHIFDEIEVGKHLPKGDTLALPDAKSAADAMIRYFWNSDEVDILDHIPFRVGYYKGVWHVYGRHNPYYIRKSYDEGNPIFVTDGIMPRVLIRAEDGTILISATRLGYKIR